MKINDLSNNHNAWLNETKLSKDLKEAYYDRNDYYDARQGGEYGKGMTYTRSGSSSVRGYDRDDALKGQTKHLPADPFGRTTGRVPNRSNKGKVHSIARADEADESGNSVVWYMIDDGEWDEHGTFDNEAAVEAYLEKCEAKGYDMDNFEVLKPGEHPDDNYAYNKGNLEEGMDSPVAGAITRRILMQRHDLLSKYGPVAVTQAIDDVADFVGDVDEIGSSDVSAWIKQVEQSLSGMSQQGVGEAGTLDKYRDRIGTSGQSDRYRDSQERDHDRRQDHYDAEHQSRLNRVSNSDRMDAARTQHEIDVLAHRLSRMQKDDDDWEKTFDMMRDRLNRYQWSSQRDVDPEQLAAISNIKYEPRKKNEAVQAKTDDKLLAYYAQRKAEAEKQKQSQHVEESSNEFRDEYNSFKGQ